MDGQTEGADSLASGAIAWLTERPIAHRGLHDLQKGRPENSMAAFTAACRAGFAIECDIQFSGDGVPMVFHDNTLDRLTDFKGPVRDRTAHSLAEINLAGTQEKIPTLANLLAYVAGKVPLVVEIKAPRASREAAATALDNIVRAYRGPLALMSFDGRLAGLLRGQIKDRPIGLVAEGGILSSLGQLMTLRRHGLQFLSYNIDHLPNPATVLTRRKLGLPVICWTVRTTLQRKKSERWTDQMTFEGFMP